MCNIPAIIIMRQYFDKKYAIFMGVITSAVGVGSCVFPVVIEKLEVVVTFFIYNKNSVGI